MLTIEEGISRFESFANLCEKNGMHEWQKEHEQYAAWLRELVECRKAPEIVRCGECKWYKASSSWNCKEYHYCARESITASVKTDNDFCSKAERAERRTDGQNQS